MLESFCPIPKMPFLSSIIPTVFVNGVPRALVAKTKSNQSQEWEATILEVLCSCFMSRYRWEGRAWGLKPPLLSHAKSFAN